MQTHRVYSTEELSKLQSLDDCIVTGQVTGVSGPIFTRLQSVNLFGFAFGPGQPVGHVGFYLDDLYCVKGEILRRSLNGTLKASAWLDKNRGKQITVRGEYHSEDNTLVVDQLIEGENLNNPVRY